MYLLNQRIADLEKGDDEVKMSSEPVVVKTVWLEMSNGSSRPVKFTMDDGRWVGPFGEYYNEEPTRDQIERLYKK